MRRRRRPTAARRTPDNRQRPDSSPHPVAGETHAACTVASPDTYAPESPVAEMTCAPLGIARPRLRENIEAHHLSVGAELNLGRAGGANSTSAGGSGAGAGRP